MPAEIAQRAVGKEAVAVDPGPTRTDVRAGLYSAGEGNRWVDFSGNPVE